MLTLPGSTFTVIALLLLGLFAALEAGFRLGRRQSRDAQAPSGSQIGTVQAAVLGLLGLLLGFSFAGAASRFIERYDLIVEEANAIGTAYLRADILDEPHAANLRSALASYVSHRLEVSQRLSGGISDEDHAEIAALHARLWSAASAGANAKPAAMVAVLNPVNDVIDLHSLRLSAATKHLPAIVMGLLFACSAVAIGLIGYGCGPTGCRHGLVNTSLVFLVASALWITIDLDHPRMGYIRLSDAPLERLQLSGGGQSRAAAAGPWILPAAPPRAAAADGWARPPIRGIVRRCVDNHGGIAP